MAEDPRQDTGLTFRNPDTGEEYIVGRGGELLPLPEVGPVQAGLTSVGTGILKAPLQVAQGATELIERGLSAVGADVTQPLSGNIGDLIDQVSVRPAQLAANKRQRGVSGVGEIAGQMAAFPSRILPQIGFGTLQSIGVGESTRDELLGIGLNALGVAGGGLLGRAAQRRGSNQLRARSPFEDEAQRAQAWQRLNNDGAPMSRGDASPLAPRGNFGRAEDVRRTTATGDAAVNQLGKMRYLNEQVLKPMGVKGKNNVSDDVRAGIDKNIDGLYNSIRDDIPNAIDPLKFDDMNDWASEYIAKYRPDDARAISFADDLARDINDGLMDGKRYLKWRKDLGKAGRNTEDIYSRELYYGLINQLDGVMESAAGVRNKLIIANQSWRYNEVLNAPGVVSPQGNVNAQAFVRNMERMFGDIRFGTGPNQMSAAFRKVRDAQLFPGFKDSGTGRRTGAGQPGLFRTTINQFKGEAGEIAGAGAGRGLVQTSLEPSLLDEVEADEQSEGETDEESN